MLVFVGLAARISNAWEYMWSIYRFDLLPILVNRRLIAAEEGLGRAHFPCSTNNCEGNILDIQIVKILFSFQIPSMNCAFRGNVAFSPPHSIGSLPPTGSGIPWADREQSRGPTSQQEAVPESFIGLAHNVEPDSWLGLPCSC